MWYELSVGTAPRPRLHKSLTEVGRPYLGVVEELLGRASEGNASRLEHIAPMGDR